MHICCDLYNINFLWACWSQSSYSSNSAFIQISLWDWQNLQPIHNVLTVFLAISALAVISRFSASQGFLAYLRGTLCSREMCFMGRVVQSNWEMQGVLKNELFHPLACRPFGGGKGETYGRAVCLVISVSSSRCHHDFSSKIMACCQRRIKVTLSLKNYRTHSNMFPPCHQQRKTLASDGGHVST